jgi:hypothetical protein
MTQEAMAASEARAPAGPPHAVVLPATIREALPVFLRHGSPRVILAALAAALVARIAVGGLGWMDLLPILATALFWPVQEWLIHVFVLHAKPREIAGRSLDFAVPQSHRAHHREPWRLELIFIPFRSFSYSLPVLIGLWFLLTPNAQLALTGLCFYLVLTLHYEWIHFLVHTRVWPKTRLYQRLWQNHRLHHFKNEHYWYGVTMLSGDRLLHTAPRPADVPVSPTVRTLVGGA